MDHDTESVHGGLMAVAAKRLTGARVHRCCLVWILAVAAWEQEEDEGSLPQVKKKMRIGT
jgi:hypothetical protein